MAKWRDLPDKQIKWLFDNRKADDVNTVSEWTIDKICQSVGDDVLAEIESLGDAINRAQWRLGEIAATWIAAGMPAMMVYSVIAKRAGKHVTSIRNYYYTYRDTSPELRETYEAPFSVFNHARQTDNPTDVLEYWRSENAGIHEIEKQFPISAENEPTEAARYDYPIYAVPFVRKLAGLTNEKRDMALDLLRRLISLIDGE